MPIYLWVQLSLHSYFKFCFRQVQTYSSIIQEHTHAYSEPSVSLVCSKPWHISFTKNIQTLRHIHNTILNIFTKAHSWRFDTVLNVPVFFYRCYLTSRVTLRLYIKHIHAYSRLTLSYLILLRDSKSPAIFTEILLQPYAGIL